MPPPQAFPVILLCLAAALAVPGAATAFPVRVLGNDFLSDRRIRNVLPEQPERPGSAEAYIIDQWAEEGSRYVRDLYRSEGFLEAEVRVEVGPAPGGEDGRIALVTVREGPRYAVDSAWVETLGPDPPGIRLPDPRLEEGEPLRYASVAEDLDRIRAVFENAGRMFVQVREEIRALPEEGRAQVRYLVDPGPVAVFDTLLIRNYQGDPADSLAGATRESRLRSLSPYKRGDTITLRRNRLYLRKLAATGVFAQLRTEVEPLRDSGSALILYAGEGEPSNLRAAAFYNGDFGFGGSFQIRNSNVFGTLNAAGAEVSAAQEMQEIGVDFSSTLFFGRRLDYNAGLSTAWFQDNSLHRALETPNFEGDFRSTGRTGVARDFSEWFRAGSDAELFVSSRLSAPDRRVRGVFLNLVQEAAFHFLDRPMRPASGFRIRFFWGNGGALDEEEDLLVRPERHNWLESRSAWYVPMLPQLTAAFRGDAGFFLGDGGINSRRFFLGGARTLRGFGYGDICPEKRTVAAEGDSVDICVETGIAPAYYLLSAELRLLPFAFVEPSPYGTLRYFAPLSLAGFADHGAVWETGERPRYSGPGAAVSYGLGLRYPLAGGFDLRLDAAWGESGAGEEVFSWVFDMLHAF